MTISFGFTKENNTLSVSKYKHQKYMDNKILTFVQTHVLLVPIFWYYILGQHHATFYNWVSFFGRDGKCFEYILSLINTSAFYLFFKNVINTSTHQVKISEHNVGLPSHIKKVKIRDHNVRLAFYMKKDLNIVAHYVSLV